MMSSTLREDFDLIAQSTTELMDVLNQYQHICVTGATGQIGWYLVRYLCDLITQGKLTCQLTAHARSLVRLTEKFPDIDELPCHFIISDDAGFSLDVSSFDLLIHCASLASPKHFAGTPVEVMIPNGIMTFHLLESIARDNPRCKFVYLSTTGVTGHVPDDQRPSTEDEFGALSCTDLKNCYLESKRFGEMLTLAYSQQHGIPSLIVRPSITYGPGFDLDDGRSYADFLTSLLDKRPIKLSSDGRAIRNFLYIADFIRGLLASICKSPTKSVLNIASNQPISILELATLLNREAHAFSLGKVEHASQPNGVHRVEFLSTDASVDRLIALGWQPLVTPLEGFRRTLHHYQEVTP